MNRFKELRLELNLTQDQLAEQVNCTSSAYSRYESEERFASYETLKRIAAFFGVTTDYLICYSDIRHDVLSKTEVDLITAARMADQRACEDALNILTAHSIEEAETEGAETDDSETKGSEIEDPVTEESEIEVSENEGSEIGMPEN